MMGTRSRTPVTPTTEEVLVRHWLSLRFHDSRTEKHFMNMQFGILAGHLFWLGLLCGCVALCHTLYLIRWGPKHSTAEPTWHLNIAASMFCFFVSASTALCAKVGVFKHFKPQTREAMVVCLMLLLAVMQFLVDPWYGARILRQDPESWLSCAGEGGGGAKFSDTKLMLTLCVLVIVGHFALPIRWVCLVPMEVLLVLLYVVFAFVEGGPDGSGSWSTLLLFQLLVFCAALGRRTIEDYQRCLFAQLVHERNTRVRAEFRASQLEDAKDHSNVEFGMKSDEGCLSDARPETSPSGKVFEIRDIMKNVGCLRDCIELGRREQWYIEEAEISVTKEFLGEGGYGIVMGGHFYGSPVAIKANKVQIEVEDQAGHESRLISLLNEIRILRRVRHPNIVILHGACFDPVHADIAIVLERVQGKSLDKLASRHSKHALSQRSRLQAVVDISRALRYLHSRCPPVVHGDLKASNIVAEQVPGSREIGRVKLLDFGLARSLTRHARPLGGTLRWMAPEVILSPSDLPRVHADIFSFGRLASYLLSGEEPCAGMKREDIVSKVRSRHVPDVTWPEPGKVDPVIARLWPCVILCLNFNWENRPSLELVGPRFEHEFGDEGSAPAPPEQKSTKTLPQSSLLTCPDTTPPAPSGVPTPLETFDGSEGPRPVEYDHSQPPGSYYEAERVRPQPKEKAHTKVLPWRGEPIGFIGVLPEEMVTEPDPNVQDSLQVPSALPFVPDVMNFSSPPDLRVRQLASDCSKKTVN